MQIEFEDASRAIARDIARQLIAEITNLRANSAWLRMEEAIEYTRLPEGTFRRLVASGEIPSHGRKRKLFHTAELDRALGYAPAQ